MRNLDMNTIRSKLIRRAFTLYNQRYIDISNRCMQNYILIRNLGMQISKE